MPVWILLGGKTVTLGFWAAFMMNLVSPFPPPMNNFLLFGGLGILLIHATECVAMFRIIRQRAPFPPLDVVQVMVFGVFHLGWLQRLPQRRP